GQGRRYLPPPREICDEIAERTPRLRSHFVAAEQRRRRDEQRLLGDATVAMNSSDRLIAEPALWGVDDALKGEVVRRLHNQAQVSDGVADLGPFVEAEAADDLIIEADRNEPLFKLAGLELGADEDCDVAERATAGFVRLDFFADPASLLGTVPDADDSYLLAIPGIRPQRLAEPACIVRYQRIGGGEDVRCRAVVLLQADDLRPGEV